MILYDFQTCGKHFAAWCTAAEIAAEVVQTVPAEKRQNLQPAEEIHTSLVVTIFAHERQRSTEDTSLIAAERCDYIAQPEHRSVTIH